MRMGQAAMHRWGWIIRLGWLLARDLLRLAGIWLHQGWGWLVQVGERHPWVQRRRAAALAAPQPCALMIMPHIDAPQDLLAMELTIQTLAIAGTRRGRAIAFEVVGWGQRRALLVRAARPEMLHYVATQLRARYPQSSVRPLAEGEDPWSLTDGEIMRARELVVVGAPYLSLRTWSPQAMGGHEHQVGVDPLLGILATLGPFPATQRVIVQLAVTPASAHWSRGLARVADQYSLSHARQEEVTRDRMQQSPTNPLPIFLLLGGLLLFGWLAQPSTHAERFPIIGATFHAWPPLWQQLLHGTAPEHLVPQLLTALAPLLGVLIGLFVFFLLLKAWFSRERSVGAPIYDPDEILRKTSQPAYHVRLRLVAIGQPEEGGVFPLEMALDQVAAAYRQFDQAGGNSLRERRLHRVWARTLLPHPHAGEGLARRRQRWSWRVPRSSMLLSLSEVATLWHLPQSFDLPELPWLEHLTTAKTLPAPQAVYATSPAAGILGMSQHAGQEVAITLGWETIRHHCLAIAKTGKGKSTLLIALARLGLLVREGADPETPRYPGLILVDPHGDLAKQMLGLIPRERQQEVVIFDLADTEHPCAFNPLDVLLGRDRDKAVENLLAVFADVWDKGWGYRMANAMSFALKTLYAANEAKIFTFAEDPRDQYTLLDVAPLLTNDTFRKHVLKQYVPAEREIQEWWADYFDKLYARLRLDVINPVLTKVAQFTTSQIARRILGQPRTTLDLTAIIRQGRILIINTASGVVGAETSRLIGATLLGVIRMTLEEQAQLAVTERRRLLVLVDEFQRLQGVDFGSMLAELRKFGASFVLTTQALAYLDRLDSDLRATVLANTDNLFAFAQSAEDAQLMADELDGVVTTRDVINLPAFTCYAKLSLGPTRLPVFSFALAPPPEGDAVLAEALRQASRRLIATQTPASIDQHLAELAAARPKAGDKEGKKSPKARDNQAMGPPERREPLMGRETISYPAAEAEPFVATVEPPPATTSERRGKRAGKGHQPPVALPEE